MKLDSMDLSVFGINEKEGKLLGALQGLSHATISEIARVTNIPRTTASFILRKLKRKKLAENIGIENHDEWRISESSELTKKIGRLYGLFGKRISQNTIDDISIGVLVIRDKRKIIETFRLAEIIPKKI